MSALINNLYSLSYNVMNLIQKEKKLGNKKQKIKYYLKS